MPVANTPRVGDDVAYYPPRTDGQIRQPLAATVSAVYPIRNVSFARAPARQYCNEIDLAFKGGRASHVAYTADAIEDEYWTWPV